MHQIIISSQFFSTNFKSLQYVGWCSKPIILSLFWCLNFSLKLRTFVLKTASVFCSISSLARLSKCWICIKITRWGRYNIGPSRRSDLCKIKTFHHFHIYRSFIPDQLPFKHAGLVWLHCIKMLTIPLSAHRHKCRAEAPLLHNNDPSELFVTRVWREAGRAEGPSSRSSNTVIRIL